MTKLRPCQVLRQNREQQIIKLLKVRSLTTLEIQTLLGLNRNTAFNILDALRHEGRIHQNRVQSHDGGRRVVWLAGANPAHVALAPTARTVRRDPLVAALFGEVCHG